MKTLALTVCFFVRYRLLRYAPTNIILIHTDGRPGIGWITLAGGLAALCLYAAAICTVLLSRDGPGWLNLLVLLFIWDGFKMLRIDPVTLMLRRYIRTEPEPESESESADGSR